MSVSFVQDTSKFWYKADISREQGAWQAGPGGLGAVGAVPDGGLGAGLRPLTRSGVLRPKPGPPEGLPGHGHRRAPASARGVNSRDFRQPSPRPGQSQLQAVAGDAPQHVSRGRRTDGRPPASPHAHTCVEELARSHARRPCLGRPQAPGEVRSPVASTHSVTCHFFREREQTRHLQRSGDRVPLG